MKGVSRITSLLLLAPLILIGCSGGDLPPIEEDPPIEPVPVGNYSLIGYNHTMQARTKVVDPDLSWGTKAKELWTKCKIDYAALGSGKGTELVPGRTASGDTITLGEQFTTSDGEGKRIEANWQAIMVRQVRYGQTQRKGMDIYYSRKVLEKGNVPIGGTTLQGLNLTVLFDPVTCTNGADCNRTQAHEIGHMLNLNHRPDSDGIDMWLMNDYLGDTGDGIEGLKSNGTIEPGSECDTSRRWGSNQRFFENAP